MTDPSRRPAGGVGPDREPAGIPRWVTISGIVVAVVVLLIVVVMVVGGGGGGHGPSRHGTGEHTPPASIAEDHTPPTGGHG
jgi:hypothetical protein